jgi:hypothetical protein
VVAVPSIQTCTVSSLFLIVVAHGMSEPRACPVDHGSQMMAAMRRRLAR